MLYERKQRSGLIHYNECGYCSQSSALFLSIFSIWTTTCKVYLAIKTSISTSAKDSTFKSIDRYDGFIIYTSHLRPSLLQDLSYKSHGSFFFFFEKQWVTGEEEHGHNEKSGSTRHLYQWLKQPPFFSCGVLESFRRFFSPFFLHLWCDHCPFYRFTSKMH